MHIPDGYLGPQTYLASYGVMVPLWAWASQKVRAGLRQREIPLMALGAAFTFVIMMFNVPVPGGTTGHAVGGVLVAILLGPWAAVVAVSVSLAVQALLFGDGGITTLGANCLNMAVIMPVAGWWTYRIMAGGSAPSSRRRAVAAAAGGYVGLNAAALSTAIMFGVQPAIAHDASGRALYCPFSLNVALPAMAVEHLLFFGIVEAVVTGAVVAYIGRTEPSLLVRRATVSQPERSPRWKKLLLGLLALALLTPLGLALPQWAGAGEAWGEWGGDRLTEMAGHVPAGLARLEALWHAPMPDYAPAGGGEAPLAVSSLWYLLSALLGIGLVGGLAAGVWWLVGRRGKYGSAP